MQFTFDLISDLHIESWPDFDWSDQATSPYCVLAGDVARDTDVLHKTLTHLGECYPGGVFYIDGNDEHRYNLNDIGESYNQLNRLIKGIPNVLYMQDNVVIINGVAILATNGWWSYDFDPIIDPEQTKFWYSDKMNLLPGSAETIATIGYNDTAYLFNSVKKLQTHQDVQAIVIVTHTVPTPSLIDHDIDLSGSFRFNCMGNRHMQLLNEEDSEQKIHTWCFGHYHKSVDRYINGVRYVNNCRGRGNTDWKQSVYYPKRIVIDF